MAVESWSASAHLASTLASLMSIIRLATSPLITPLASSTDVWFTYLILECGLWSCIVEFYLAITIIELWLLLLINLYKEFIIAWFNVFNEFDLEIDDVYQRNVKHSLE